MAYLTSNSVDKERFLCIYPAYINSKKTLAEGRRIPTEKKKTLFYVAEIIPKLKTRTQKSGGGDSGAQPGEGRKKGKKKK